ncbi:MAG: hypothetical protein M3220_22690 [Chloroflexota bacterium]|nr:hypothetical protein [Chloroflexota bacterium]
MKFRLLRPTIDTPFHIDWDWFERNNISMESVIRNQLSEEYQRRFEGQEVHEVDYIDPATGEVFRVDNLREAILAEGQWEPDYITRSMPLTQAILRIFLASNNQPLTPVELARRLERHDPEAILRVLTASGVSNGVVPVRK